VVDDHRRGDMNAYVYATEGYGERFERLPTAGVDGFVHEIEEDPGEPNLLFLGSELGLYFSMDRGSSWMRWPGIPAAPVREAIVHPRDGDLVVSTHGRAVYIVDDVQPLRALAGDPSIRTRALHVFPAPPAQQHQVAMEGDLGIHLGYRVVGNAMFFGESKPYGAIVSYWVGTAVDGAAQIQIRATDGRVVRELEGTALQGVNRIVWDLHEAPAQVAQGGGGGGGGGGQGPEVDPGRYQVTVRVGGQEASTTVDVLADPRKEGVDFFITR
jgi:hypothetical protein